MLNINIAVIYGDLKMKSVDSSPALEQLLRDRAVHESGFLQAFQTYLYLLEKWNARINITAASAWSAVGPFFEEAIWAVGFYPPGERLHLDIGSGGGFPVVPLRILRPEMRLTMVESRLKRCTFLETVVRELALGATVVVNRRLDEFLEDQNTSGSWEMVSWKAVRMGPKETDLLMDRTAPHVQFWLFHAKELPVSDPSGWQKSTTLVRTESCPARPGWWLSIYQKNR